ncbi:MAG: sodium-dependent bicarbonate transport family permease [Bdellovibrionota bacterium]|nr:sodium-dependent bicarbonate transport family permease [Deltaproteobacteria bacterium]
MLADFIHNFQANLFKPLILFFLLGFGIPLLKVPYQFPDALYKALTTYLLLAIGWHGGIELAQLRSSELLNAVGYITLGVLTNGLIGILAYGFLKKWACLRKIDCAAIAGYYGSVSAGTFVTAVGMLNSSGIAYNSYMPVMLAAMEIPGCFVALFLVSRLRNQKMDTLGNVPGEKGYRDDLVETKHTEHILSKKVLLEILLNPGLYLLFGGILIGIVAGMQGSNPEKGDYLLFVKLFQPLLSLFLLSVGMMASQHLKDLKNVGSCFYVFGLLGPNVFALIGVIMTFFYMRVTGHQVEQGSIVLFAVLCASASYIALPAIQQLAFPKASPTLPLATSLGLTFTYNVTIGIPVYQQMAQMICG